jgi:hypothetical protein
MSFGNQSAVHNHLSTKHPLIPHRLLEDQARARLVEPDFEEGETDERGPPLKSPGPKILRSDS